MIFLRWRKRQTVPMNREQRDQQLFDQIAAHYARKDRVPSSAVARKTQLFFALQPLLAERANLGTVVEIGCGIGAPARYLHGYYERYIGIDHSPEMIRMAAVYNKGNPRAHFIAGNIKAIDLPHTADLIFADGALHHMTNLDDVMAHLASIAKPGAFLVAREPQNGNPLIQALRRLRATVDSAYSEEQIYFSEAQIIELFQRHGLTDLRTDFQGFFIPPFAQVVINPQRLTTPLSCLAGHIDKWLQAHLSRTLKKLSFNIVAIGVFPKSSPPGERA